MPIQEIPVGGLSALDIDEKVPIEAAIVAMNCIVDDDSVKGRPAYRSILSGSIGGGGIPQGLWRYRINPTTAVTIAVINGAIIKITDPTSDGASDGSSATLSTPFGIGDKISGVQLGRYLYLGSNATAPVFCRVNPDYTVTTIANLPQGVAPTVSYSSLSIVSLQALTPAAAGGAGYDTLYTDWHRMTDGAAGHCPVGGTLTYTLTNAIAAADNTWLQIFATPPTQQSGWGKLKIEVATLAGNFEAVGTMQDGAGGGSPNVIWCNLNQLTPTTQASIKRIRFTMLDAAGYAGIYGVMYVPTAPAAGSQKYNVTFKNSATGQRSALTADVDVTFSSDTVTIPQYHSVYANRDAFVDAGMAGASPDVVPSSRNWNQEGGLAWPDRSVYAAVATLAGTIPTDCLYPNSDTVELWRLTDTGRRIVKTVTLTTSATTTYSITDDQGSATSAHELYKAGGALGQTEAMAAFGGRIVTGYQNRFGCSNFAPFAPTSGTDAYPQFPAIPIIDADGFAFDMAPSPTEQIRGLVGQDKRADVLYVLTNEGVYVMPDLTPNVESGGAQSVPYRIYSRGATGRRAWCFAENMLFWAGNDGIYFAVNRTVCDELSRGVRRLVTDWLQPSGETVLFYRKRKLYVVNGLKYMRYDFVKSRWTTGTFTQQILFATFWQEDISTTGTLATAAQDTFTGADATTIASHTADTLQTWSAASWAGNGYNPSIYSNKQTGPNAAGDVSAAMIFNLNPTNPEYTVQSTCTRPVASGGAFTYCLCARMSNSQATYYRAGFRSQSGGAASNGWVIEKLVNGAYTQLAFLQALFPVGETHTLRFDCNNAFKRLWVDDVLVLATTDNAIATAGNPGFYAFNQKNGAEGITADNFTVSTVTTGTVTEGAQTWLFLDNNYVARLQETATSDLMIGSTPGTTIPDWIYSTGYLFSPIRYTVDTLFVDATGDVSINSYKSATDDVVRSADVSAGEVEIAAWPDFQGYKMRLQFSGKSTTQLRRMGWNLAGNDGVGT